ncbi:MAG: hypothetical protein C3F06_13015 [Candidatus Methanoperedenaceae archaeon]|nr:MAG: hypothetical protein C3F06_13015 [Candidatus Methanoperedenaceae archaeon]
MTKRIPDFKSLEEAAEYWDTHSFADHIEDTEPVEIEVSLTRRRIIFEIDNDMLEKLKKIAHKKKKGYDKRISSWIREKIIQEASKN